MENLYQKNIQTPIGEMLAVADDMALYLLEFVERDALEGRVEQLSRLLNKKAVEGTNRILDFLEEELVLYFEGTLTGFKTPYQMIGTPFQESVWKELLKIPYGATRSYANIANAIGKPTAFRAVAQANRANRLALIIPCHRVINANGDLGGYAGTLPKKEWLLRHEQ